MLCIGTAFALVGLEMILNKAERQQVRARLERSGKDIVELIAIRLRTSRAMRLNYITDMAKNCSCLSTAPFGL
jgi:hypothetical protein